MERMLKKDPEQKRVLDELTSYFVKHPELRNHHNFYEFTPEEKRIDLWKRNIFVDKTYP